MIVSVPRRFTIVSATLWLFGCAILIPTTWGCSCPSEQPTNFITTEVVDAADAVARLYIHTAITNPVVDENDEFRYYTATVYHWYKGDVGKGKIIIKTGVSETMCGADLTVRAFSVLFGTVSNEAVPGYAGTVSILNVERCQPQKVTTTISKAEWATLASYLVCTDASCADLTKPILLDPLTCPRGTEYRDSAVCEAQDAGRCGWTVSAQCKPLPVPDVCLASHCDGLDQPTLSCPTGTVMDSPTFRCEKQSGGSCGWTGSATCSEPVMNIPAKVSPGEVCAVTACDGLTKPVFPTPLVCPKGTEYAETALCHGQDNGRCGWTVTANCTKVVNTTNIVCVDNDCVGINKPKLPASFVCPTGFRLIELSNCVLQPTVGLCGWSVRGQCQKIQ